MKRRLLNQKKKKEEMNESKRMLFNFAGLGVNMSNTAQVLDNDTSQDRQISGLLFPQLGCGKEKKEDRKFQVKPSSIGDDTIEFLNIEENVKQKKVAVESKDSIQNTDV